MFEKRFLCSLLFSPSDFALSLLLLSFPTSLISARSIESHRNMQCLWLSPVLFLPSSVIFPPLSLIQSFCLDSLNSTRCRTVCLCVGFVQTSCGPGWISSPARLLLEIHPGFSSQSKSGRPRLSQHNTGPSVSTYSSSSSAVQGERERPREGRERLGLCFLLKKSPTV